MRPSHTFLRGKTRRRGYDSHAVSFDHVASEEDKLAKRARTAGAEDVAGRSSALGRVGAFRVMENLIYVRKRGAALPADHRRHGLGPYSSWRCSGEI